VHGAGSGGHRVARRQVVAMVIVRSLVCALVRHLGGDSCITGKDLL